MSSFPFLLVDAFTERPLAGNACAVVLDAGDLSPATMQAIAREMNQSETAYVRSQKGNTFEVRYFTPGAEIPLAGHPTIATVAALIDAGRLAAPEGRTELTFSLRDGPISIAVERRGADRPSVVMTQRRPLFRPPLEVSTVTAAFGLPAEAVRDDAPVQVVSTGTEQLMVPLRSKEWLRRAVVDVARFRALQQTAGFFSAHLFVLEGATPEGRTFARHMAISPDLFEDPVTGSATGGMGAYLFHHRLIAERDFVAEQGHWMGRPGRVAVHVEGTPQDVQWVSVAGTAVVVVRGTLDIPR
jgi:trans-2,3-dihydro-3-hydroxyanthranilate isomerase